MKNNSDLKAICHHNSLSTDYLAEFAAALMIENGISTDTGIRIVRTGSNRAKIAKEIESIEKKYTLNRLEEEYIEIKVNREGLVDILPENLFFDNRHSLNTPANIKQIKQEINSVRIEEEEIRRVFSLFENEIDAIRIQMHLWEHQLDKSSRYRNFIDLFAGQWPIIELLEADEGWLFIHILLRIHHIRGNNEEIEQALTSILKLPVKLLPVKVRQTSPQLPSAERERLDFSFIRNEYYINNQKDYILQVNNIPSERIKEFLPGGKCVKLLDEITKMLFEADIMIEKQLNMLPPEDIFKINENEKTDAFLDINAHL